MFLSFFSLQAQDYYYNGAEKVYVHESEKSFITYDKPSNIIKKGFGKAKTYAAKGFTILENKKENFSSKSLLIGAQNQSTPALLLEKNSKFKMYPTRTIRVKLKSGSKQEDIETLLKYDNIIQIDKKYDVFRIRINDIHKTLEIANKVYESGLAVFSTPDFYIPIVLNQQINDPLFPLQFQMNNTGQVVDGIAGVNDMDCNALQAWELALGNDVIVAVIDNGMENHEDIDNRLIGGFTPATNGNGTPTVNDATHGMNCAGIIGASHNNLGVRGVAPNINFLSVNIFENGSTNLDIADGIQWAVDNGADVISNSWGFSLAACNFNDVGIDNAIQEATADGVVVIFASGNGGGCVEYPATNANVISVGAINNRGNLYGYSARGPELDLVAPSGNRFGDVGVRTLDRMGVAGGFNGNYRNDFDGTSAAAPVVAGVAALILSVNPNLTPQEVRTILTSTATDMGAVGFDNNFGFGRVNALAAVEEAINQILRVSTIQNLCSEENKTASLQNNIYGGDVSWSSSSNVHVLSSTNSSATIEPRFSTSSGNGWVRALLENGITRTRNFWVGPASFGSDRNLYVQGYYNQNSITLTSNALYTFQVTGGEGNFGDYTWQLPNGFSVFGSSTSAVANIWTSSTGGNYTLKAIPVNSCGSEGATESLSIYIPSFGGGISPDPNCPNPPCQIPHANNLRSSQQEEMIYINTQKRLIIKGYDEHATVQVYTINGKRIMSLKNNSPINLSKLNAGIYLITILEEGQIKKQRVILN